VSLRKFLNSNGVQHVGVNVDDMSLSSEFYCDILGGIFISEINGISGEEWTSILNGVEKNAPQLGKGDALDVCLCLLEILLLSSFAIIMKSQV